MTDHHALIVDDEPHIRELIELTFVALGIQCHGVGTLAAARDQLRQRRFSFCITDMQLPDGNGLDLVSHIQRHLPELPVAVITAHGNVESAVEALKRGAFDFVQKPFELAVLRNLVSTALRLSSTVQPVAAASQPQLLGQSAVMERTRQLIGKLARSQAPVMITGESGTGKELAARQIHATGPRADGPFVPVNCGAIPEHLLESEFFGHKKGSFTGATQDKAGLFQAANGGTLFLDEVGELPPAMQVKLLRAIQERAVRPIGEHREIGIDVRILSATNRDLDLLVKESRFRQDLYYRLNVIELRMPSLRERPDDIPDLAAATLVKISHPSGQPGPRLSPAALDTLRGYDFPGNVRELENILERAQTLCEGEIIQPADLDLPTAAPRPDPPPEPAQDDPPPATPTPPIPQSTTTKGDPPTQNLESYLEQLERDAITQALEATRYNKTAAAEILGISFRALRYRLKKLGID